jgi:hypothetical protein
MLDIGEMNYCTLLKIKSSAVLHLKGQISHK